MRSLIEGLPPEIAKRVHPDWQKNEPNIGRSVTRCSDNIPINGLALPKGASSYPARARSTSFMRPKHPVNILSSHAWVTKTSPTGCAAPPSHMIQPIQTNLYL